MTPLCAKPVEAAPKDARTKIFFRSWVGSGGATRCPGGAGSDADTSMGSTYLTDGEDMFPKLLSSDAP